MIERKWRYRHRAPLAGRALFGFLVGGMDGFARVYYQPDHASPRAYARGHALGRWMGEWGIGLALLALSAGLLAWVLYV